MLDLFKRGANGNGFVMVGQQSQHANNAIHALRLIQQLRQTKLAQATANPRKPR